MHAQKRKRNGVLCLLAALGLTLGVAATASGQTAGTGQINGTVTDPGGLVVPEAEVIVRNVGTGAQIRLTTTEAGRFAAPFLQPGRYEVTVRKEGFAEVKRENITVEVGQTVTLDLELPLREARETVVVTTELPLVETEKFEVSQIIGERALENIPLNGRRWDNLVLLTPGVSEDGGFGGISFRGINSLYNNNMVDGADNNQAFFSEARGRTRIAYGYSLNAIKEFQVQTAAYSAEYGRAAGGIVNAVTRSGSNVLHGDFFYFIRDDLWLARDPIANASGQPKPDERRQQFGGSLSGPLVADKLFFFLNYDQQKRNFPAVIIPFNANFFDTSDPNSQAARCTHPRCPEVLAALAAITNTIAPRKGDQYLGLAKLDYQLDPSNRISGVFNILRWKSPNGILTSPVLTSTALANGTDLVDNEFLTVTWTYVITPNVVNEARFQYGRDFERQTPNASGPSFTISGAASFGMPNFLPRGAFPNEKRFQWTDNVSYLRGRHQFKFGLDINHVRDNLQNLFQGGGVYNYSGTTALNNFVSDIFDGTRRYSSFVQTVDPITGSGKGFFTTNDYNFYIQDNIKLLPSLTINLGLRYELQDMPKVVQANPAVPETARLNTDTNNWGPRFGFAWGLGGAQKTVLRGGYGIYYGRTQNSSIFVHLFQNGVFQQLFSFTPSTPGAPIAPNVVFPLPDTAPPFGPIFGTSGPVPRNNFNSLEEFLAAFPSARGSAVVDVLAPDFVNPIVHQYDLAVERELFWNMSVSVSYVGSRGQRLPVFVDANLPRPDSTATYAVLDASNSLQRTFQVPFWSGAVPRPNPRVGVILMGKSVINSWYNGMLLRVRRRGERFFFDANFTWSQARDNGQVAGVNGTFAGTTNPLNPFDLRSEYGLSDIDIRRRFIFHATWVMPWGDYTDNAGLKALIGGWRASGVIRVQDGRPVEAQMGSRPSCAFNGGLTCAVISSTGGPVNGRVPFIPRNTLFTTPALKVVDLRITREFRLTERTTFEFLWEAFNLFNHTNGFSVDNRMFFFASSSSNPAAPCSATRLGISASDFRGCLTPNNSFLAVRSTSNTLYTARQMQFGARIRF
ncbi:MAG: TonB-dependent receptor [Acidobacteriia bacterium]|jgi:hypothetical protein|nr:TonB-dependent receptor [Terriglobia bacterium]